MLQHRRLYRRRKVVIFSIFVFVYMFSFFLHSIPPFALVSIAPGLFFVCEYYCWFTHLLSPSSFFVNTTVDSHISLPLVHFFVNSTNGSHIYSPLVFVSCSNSYKTKIWSADSTNVKVLIICFFLFYFYNIFRQFLSTRKGSSTKLGHSTGPKELHFDFCRSVTRNLGDVAFTCDVRLNLDEWEE